MNRHAEIYRVTLSTEIHFHSSRTANTTTNGDIRHKHDIKTELSVGHVGKIVMADALEVVAPLSLRAALQVLVAVKFDHLGKGLGVHAAALQSSRPVSTSYLSFGFPSGNDAD